MDKVEKARPPAIAENEAVRFDTIERSRFHHERALANARSMASGISSASTRSAAAMNRRYGDGTPVEQFRRSQPAYNKRAPPISREANHNAIASHPQLTRGCGTKWNASSNASTKAIRIRTNPIPILVSFYIVLGS